MFQFNFKKSLDFDLKNLRVTYFARINFMLLDFDSKIIWTTVWYSDWFCDILELDWKKYLDYLTGFGLILWYIRLGLEKHLD